MHQFQAALILLTLSCALKTNSMEKPTIITQLEESMAEHISAKSYLTSSRTHEPCETL